MLAESNDNGNKEQRLNLDQKAFAEGYRFKRVLLSVLLRLAWPFRAVYTCPICHYRGPFKKKTTRRYHHVRTDAKCPCCRANERARLQYLVTAEALSRRGDGQLDILHIAPEKILAKWLRPKARRYVSADLFREDVDCRFDIESIPFADGSFDLVFASHVLVYAKDDLKAIAEVRRILRPGGIAIMPVPIVGDKTVDPEGHRFFHEPGLDYTDRFRGVFDDVREYFSSEFDARYQLYFYESALPGAPAAQAEPHPASMRVSEGKYSDMVPVCQVAAKPD